MLNLVLRAAAWGYAGTFLKLVMQFGAQIVLARLLGPHEYGLFAIGVMVVSFGLFFGDVASSALIPQKNISTEEIRFAFTWQLIISGVVTVIIALAAGKMANFIHEPRAENVIRLLSLVCVLNAIGGVSLALLRRSIDFKVIQVAQVLGYFVGYVLLAIPYAIFIGPSVLALVVAWLGQVVVTSTIYLLNASHSVKPLFSCPKRRELVDFGLHSFVANISTWSIMNLDKMVIARAFPVSQVGLYSTASNLLSTPITLIYSTLQQLMFSASSQISNQGAGKVFSAMVAIVVVFVGCGYAFAFAMAQPIVLLLYGSKWIAAVPFVKAFSVAMFFYALSGVVTPLLWGQGAVRQDAKIQLLMAILIGCGALLFSRYSPIAIAWWVAFVYALRAIILLLTGLRIFPEIRITLYECVLRGMFSIFLAGLVFISVDWVLSVIHLSNLIRLLIGVIVFFGLMVTFVRNRHMLGVGFSNSVEKILLKLSLSKTLEDFFNIKGEFNV